MPYSPVTGPRLLVGDAPDPDALRGTLVRAARDEAARLRLSSAHLNFATAADAAAPCGDGWLERVDWQFHWRNRGYTTFDDFLDVLASRKRKAIRKERAAALDGLTVRHIASADIGEADWDAFWIFYQDTGARKWGTPYLTRRFFSLLGERMADRVLLIVAERDGKPIAGALNLIGADTLYGRYWGCTEDVPFLHFELCYYQAIDAAIARGLSTVEAGAQGEHKLARGYEPTPTWSAHYLPDPGFRQAVADFLERERAAVESDEEFLGSMTPFRKG